MPTISVLETVAAIPNYPEFPDSCASRERRPAKVPVNLQGPLKGGDQGVRAIQAPIARPLLAGGLWTLLLL
jgi:hypothetical protein